MILYCLHYKYKYTTNELFVICDNSISLREANLVLL